LSLKKQGKEKIQDQRLRLVLSQDTKRLLVIIEERDHRIY